MMGRMRAPGIRRLVLAVLVALPLAVSAAPAEAPIPALDALRLWRPTARIEAPPFELATLEGRPARLVDLRGRVVLLYFWATW
jgi:cytochrome oxidase Cu insertion factor (SCO1/SenC/PrrC family)